MREHSGKQSISGLAALLLLGVFAAGILSVLLSGAGAYRRLTERDRLSYDSRTCVQYIATKIRQAPAPEAITLSRFGDSDSIIIRESIKGEDYCTQVYCYKGWLMELFTTAGDGFEPADGEKIMQAQCLSLSRENNLLRVEILDGNATKSSVLLNIRGGGEVQP